MISVKSNHEWRHAAKFCNACHAWKSPCHARYLVDNCHVFQSGLLGALVKQGPTHYGYCWSPFESSVVCLLIAVALGGPLRAELW